MGKPSLGEGGTAASGPQISACSYLWLTIIYADFFLIFFLTHMPNAQHISLSQSSRWEFVCYLECNIVLLVCACRAMCHTYLYKPAKDHCMLTLNEYCRLKYSFIGSMPQKIRLQDCVINRVSSPCCWHAIRVTSRQDHKEKYKILTVLVSQSLVVAS